MIKHLAVALLLFAAPFTVCAIEPVTLGEDTPMLADNNIAATADALSPTATDAVDTMADDAQEAVAAPVADTPRAAAMRPDTARTAPATAASRASRAKAAAHKEQHGTRWQSLLPGVMK